MEQPDIKQTILNHTTHIGKILSDISIFGIVLSLVSVFGFVFVAIYYAFYYLFLILTIAVTLGIVFVIPGYTDLWAYDQVVVDIASAIASAGIIIAPLAVATSVLSLVFLLLDKKNLSLGRIIFSIVLIVITVVILIAGLIIGFGTGGAA